MMAVTYTSAVDSAVNGVADSAIYDFRGSISFSEQLQDQTTDILKVIASIEQVMDEYEALMRKLEFYFRQEYNSVRYKLESTVSASTWKFRGRANKVSSG